jgi:MarR family transcriptional regulator, lower aerobic nicotinate degradation pathway regulator
METIKKTPVPQAYPDELVSSPLFLLKRLGMEAKEDSFRAYEEIGLHPYHYAILALLDEGARETQGQIAQALGYDKAQLVGLLDELEEAGLVERRRDTADRRRHLVVMTTAGRKALERLRRLSAELDAAFLAPLSDKEREQLHSLLLKVAQLHLPNCRKIAAAVTAA